MLVIVTERVVLTGHKSLHLDKDREDNNMVVHISIICGCSKCALLSDNNSVHANNIQKAEFDENLS